MPCDVVKNDKGVFVEKSREDRLIADKVFMSFRLGTAPKMVQIFPILGTDFCAKLAAKRQLGSLHAHRQANELKISKLPMKSALACRCRPPSMECAQSLTIFCLSSED